MSFTSRRQRTLRCCLSSTMCLPLWRRPASKATCCASDVSAPPCVPLLTQRQSVSTTWASTPLTSSTSVLPLQATFASEHNGLPFPRALPPALLTGSTPLSRRTERQLEHQYGPMWRYMAFISQQTPSPDPCSSLSDNGGTTARDDGQEHRRQLLVERAREVGLIDPTAPILSAGTAAERAANATSVGAPRHATEGWSSSSVVAPPETDPLIQFLEKNEEDAALLLAMWTSLRRSCLYASEISESLSLRVRYFFHSLIHRRAIAAAVGLYHRLAYLGVQLKHHDLVLLLSNLPYEHSSAAQTTVDAWRKEGAQAEQDKRRYRERSHRIALEVKKAAERRRQTEERATQRQAAHAQEVRPGTETGDAEQADASSPPASSSSSALMQLQVLAEQPEWVKRWVLYEASMGNLDLYGEDAVVDMLSHDAEAVADVALKNGSLGEMLPDTEYNLDAVSSARASSDAARTFMEATALLRHIYLLQVTAHVREEWIADARTEVMQGMPSGTLVGQMRVAKTSGGAVRGRSRTSFRSRRSYRRGAVDHRTVGASRFWKEGLHVLRRFFKKSGLAGGDGSANDLVTGQPPSLPDSLLEVVRDIVRASESWRASVAFAKVLARVHGALQSADAVLFFRVACSFRATPHTGQGSRAGVASHAASPPFPWRQQSAVEGLVDSEFIPRVPTDTAAGYAVQALWLCHLCRVKSDNPERFLDLVETVAERWQLSPGASGLSALIGEAMTKTKLATSLLVVEATRCVAAQAAEATLAASIRSGAFSDNREQAQSFGLVAGLGERYGSSPTTWQDGEGGARLPAALLDALVIACHSVVETLGMTILHATLAESSAVVSLQDFLESTLYGPFGLWSTFRQVYLESPSRGQGVSLIAATEGPSVAALLAITMLRCTRMLCQAELGPSVRSQAKLLLELSLMAVEQIPVGDKLVVGRGALEEADRVALENATAAVARPLLSLLGLSRPDERAFFGAVPDDVVECLALYGKLAVAVNARSGRKSSGRKVVLMRGNGLSRSPSVARSNAFVELLTPRTRRLLSRVCYARTNNLGRRVRGRLSRREAQELDNLLRSDKRSRTYVESAHRDSDVNEGGQRSVQRALLQTSAEEFRTLCEVRSSVYAAVLSARAASDAPGAADEALCSLVHSVSDEPRLALSVCRILVVDMAARRHTVSLSFFRAVLQAMAASSGDLSSASNISWSDAVWVFWSAVDHTGPGRSADAAKGAQRMREHERDVSTQLLVPMLDVSRAIHRTDAGHQWRKQWVSSFSRDEKRSAEWRKKNIEALAALRDANALQHASSLLVDLQQDVSGNADPVSSFGPRVARDGNRNPEVSSLLLCTIASQHRNWEEALKALYTAFGTPEEREKTRLPYALPVVHATLDALARAPTNLGNTALRLRSIQLTAPTVALAEGSPAHWDLQASNGVLRLLLQARRWRQALEVAKATTELPEVTSVRAAFERPPGSTAVTSLSTHLLLEYVDFLLFALRACAIGGQGEDASSFYDQFQSMLQPYTSSHEPRQTPGTAGAHDASADGSSGAVSARTLPPSPADDDMDLLEQTLDRAGGAFSGTTHSEPLESVETTPLVPREVRATLEEQAPRARALYFRAVTKKMTAPTSHKVKRGTDSESRITRES